MGGSKVRHARRAKGRETAFGTSARWGGEGSRSLRRERPSQRTEAGCQPLSLGDEPEQRLLGEYALSLCRHSNLPLRSVERGCDSQAHGKTICRHPFAKLRRVERLSVCEPLTSKFERSVEADPEPLGGLDHRCSLGLWA